MSGPTTDARIYLLDRDEQQVSPGGPAVVGPDGVREEIPPLVFRAIQHVVEAMSAGMAVKVSPYQPELPIDEAADAIGMARDDLCAYVAEGADPFRSSEYVDWVRLTDVLTFNERLRKQRREALDAMLSESVYDDSQAPGLEQ
jgi:hypothetical protein